ncbi:MAG: PD-(D/E)XK nuclease family protein [Candidatus Cloacimonetes bacterium]|nr:PD-(D/E)XK nuclease family protein [Candidatus Cloacimonadota bacterium]
MINFKFIAIQENLIEKIFQNEIKDKTIIVFPNNNSRNIGLEILQTEWKFQDILLLTMEDIYNLLSLTDKPCLQDAKRLLMFYQSLNSEIKEKYNLTDYFSFISFGNSFFGLFQELREESISLEIVEEKLYYQGFLTEWQSATWQDMLLMRKEYEIYLQNTDYNDIIFTETNFEAAKEYLSGYDNIVFANQFYFSESEKTMLKLLSEKKEVTLYFQMSEDMVDKQNFKVKDFFSYQFIDNKRIKKLHLYSAANDFAMLNRTIEVLETENIKTVVDYDFYKHSWFNFLSNEKFAKPQSYPFINSEIYRFFQGLLNIFSSVKYVVERKKYLFPLQEIFSYFVENDYSALFSSEKVAKNDFIDFFIKLSNKGYLYFDPFEISFLIKETSCPNIQNKFIYFADLIKKLLKIRQMNDLISLIDVEDGIMINSICNPDSLGYTDLAEIFYEILSNIHGIEDFGIVRDWKEIFPSTPSQPIIINLLRFFVEFLKPSLVSFQSETQGQIKFCTLLDTRNIVYENLVFLNVTEGILPKAKSVDFLFNEKQREIIGLKTYDDIRQREKYYFMRLILSTRECHIFYTENEDENVEKSSFVEELEIIFPNIINRYQCEDKGYVEMWEDKKFQVDKSFSKSVKDVISPISHDFCILPSSFDTDFQTPFVIKLNTYTISELIRDPFYWFINSNLGFKRFQYPVKDRLDNKILGIIVHTFLEKIFLLIKANIMNNQSEKGKRFISLGQYREGLNDKNLDEVYQELIYKQNIYKFPHDFSGKYFEKVLFPIVKKRIKSFFLESELVNISDNSIVNMEILIPETLFLETDDYKVFLSGKPDMVITTLDNQAISTQKINHIIDFKTGKEDKSQLYLYQWLLSKNTEESQSFEYDMRFFSIFNTAIIKPLQEEEEAIIKIQDKLKETLDICNKLGYFYPKLKSEKIKYFEISRIDLYQKTKNNI